MRHLRPALVSVLAVVAAVCMRSWGGHLPWQLWIPTALLGATALLVHHGHVGSQLLARAVLWSNLILGGLVSWVGGVSEKPVAVVLALTTGAGLLLLGRRGLDGDARDGSFVPVAFRATLVAILVMALADAQTLLLFGSLAASESRVGGQAALPLALAGALLLSIAGLYRLRVWGIFLNGMACAGLIAFAALNVIAFPPELNAVFITSGALQLILAAPILFALFAGARKRPSIARGSAWIGAVAIAGIMVAALVPLALRVF